ncbi:hypothetical protein SRB17_73260 [Streptomyces sp. RB17]|uniref:hypothetical protein n=1 Tax=Streptomyces sp. RB17 TaxID=2585197 RepID=UPI00130C03CE|nr:hypothetical protein [Streptomyces sp. RB17]MQY39304.1 hypothetical protein [Streptomyces sp. RB17]
MPTASPTPSADLYGTVVDAVDRAPDPDTPPAALPHRPETGLTSSGGAHAVMNHRGGSVTPRGTGYVLVRRQISPQYRSGSLVMPAWTGLTGKLFHVASGGGRRMDDPLGTDAAVTGMAIRPSATTCCRPAPSSCGRTSTSTSTAAPRSPRTNAVPTTA